MTRPALLALADGRVFRGEALGAAGEGHGEVVFNTSMTGYQEILTDPSYRGQMICMTYPLIGNYGINLEDVESRRPWLSGFIVKEACPFPSRGASSRPRSGTARASPSGPAPCPDCSAATWSPR